MKNFRVFLAFVFFLSTYSTAEAQVRMRNAQQLRQAYGLGFYNSSNVENLKIAVLDNDFEGYSQNKDSLPANTQVIPGPLRTARGADLNGHGLLMAQIVWNMTGSRAAGPQFYLIQANGITNFRAAIDKAIELNVDIILYAAVWETGGNFDGQGFINAEVNRATQKGISWINAAGNDHRNVFTTQIAIDNSTGLVRLPGPNSTLSFSVKHSNTPVKLTASWSDFRNEESHQTQKDLDWELRDMSGTIVPLRTYSQGSHTRCSATPEYANESKREESLHPREQDEIMLNEGVYYLKLIDCSANFDRNDNVRVSIQSPKELEFHQAQGRWEIMTPADNPNVITIGDTSPVSSMGPTLVSVNKPDFRLTQTKVEMSDGRTLPGGSSVAAAIYTGIFASLKAQDSRLNKNTIDRFQSRLFQEQRSQLPQGVGPFWRTPHPNEFQALFW